MLAQHLLFLLVSVGTVICIILRVQVHGPIGHLKDVADPDTVEESVDLLFSSRQRRTGRCRGGNRLWRSRAEEATVGWCPVRVRVRILLASRLDPRRPCQSLALLNEPPRDFEFRGVRRRRRA